jgi:large subunit ribosomal protein L15
MSLSLHTIKLSVGAKKKKKRVGRGNASGHGTYSTRGLKGQKSRSGVSGLKRLGMKQVLLRTPKIKGFKSLRPKDQVINLRQINKFFHDGGEVNLKSLKELGLVADLGSQSHFRKAGIKLLGSGKLTVKNLQVSGLKMSDSVKKQLEEMGGKIVS